MGSASHRGLPKTSKPPEPLALLVPCGKTDRALAGTCAIAEKKLAAKLGHVAFTLWQLLCKLRDPRTGRTTVTLGSLGAWPGWESFPHGTCKRALARLRAAGLVRTVGRKMRGHVAYQERRVFGAPAALPGQVLVAVPEATARWVTAAPGWGGARKGAGGARPGAGRPKGAKARRAAARPMEALAAVEDRLTWGAGPLADSDAGDSASRAAPGGDQSSSRAIAIQQGGPTFNLNINKLESSPSDEGEDKPAPSGRGAVSPSGGDAREPGVEAPGPTACAAPVPPRHAPVKAPAAPGAVAGRKGGPGAPRPVGFVDVTGTLGVPPLPLAALARVPSPPQLVAEDGDERNAYLLATWYTGAIEAAYGRRCWIFAKGPVATSKHFRMLVVAARAFIAHNIAPAAWVAWSISVWRQHKPDDFPPLAWVFGPKRIEERRGWYRDDSVGFNVAGVVTPPAWAELRARYAEMTRALATEPGLTPESAREIVDVFLPAALLDDLKERSRAEATALTAKLKERVYVGHWVWGVEGMTARSAQ